MDQNKPNNRKSILLAVALVLLLAVCAVFFIPKLLKSNPHPGQNLGQGTAQATIESGENGESASGGQEDPNGQVDPNGQTDPNQATGESTDPSSKPTGPSNESSDNADHPKAPELTWIQNLDIPAYDGKAYIMLNDGNPFFDTTSLTPDAYEIYYDLDELGRCTLADCVAGKELMPTGKRGNIGSVKPTGWHTTKYDKKLVDGEALYNRCHLIAYGLCGETANKYNLVTGTRYFNTKGVNDFENMVIDYIRETGNHVRYRVTPVWTGDNLICDGQVVEAWSIEDEGEAICFNIYAYNVQPGIIIDYATGDNWLDPDANLPQATKKTTKKPQDGSKPAGSITDQDYEGDFIINVKKKKFHSPDCSGAQSLNESNKQSYHGNFQDLIKQGLDPHEGCLGI